MKTTMQTIRMPADPDADDCLLAAVYAYTVDHPEVRGWNLRPRWEDENERDTVLLTVPVTSHVDSIENCDDPDEYEARILDAERDDRDDAMRRADRES